MVRYHVTISHAGGSERVSYVIKDAESIPVYTSALNKFNGSLEQFADLSDAVSLYMDFASNLNKSYSLSQNVPFEYPKTPQTTKPYTLDDGIIVQTCELSLGTMMSTGEVATSKYEIWPLSVFERRLGSRGQSLGRPSFDTKLATELLENTTISALSMNERFDTVNGTESRSFNIYHFQNKLVFFLPYGLSLGLAIPVIVLGLIALYVQNGVSAISGGFIQLLITTIGRTAM
jgi:hypothetical protein